MTMRNRLGVHEETIREEWGKYDKTFTTVVAATNQDNQ